MTAENNEIVFYNLPSDAVQHGPFKLRSIGLDKNGEPRMIGEFIEDFPEARDWGELDKKFKNDRKMRRFLKQRTMVVSVNTGQYGIGFVVVVRGEIDNPSNEFLAMVANVFENCTTVELSELRKKREKIEAEEDQIKSFVTTVNPMLHPTPDYSI